MHCRHRQCGHRISCRRARARERKAVVIAPKCWYERRRMLTILMWKLTSSKMHSKTSSLCKSKCVDDWVVFWLCLSVRSFNCCLRREYTGCLKCFRKQRKTFSTNKQIRWNFVCWYLSTYAVFMEIFSSVYHRNLNEHSKSIEVSTDEISSNLFIPIKHFPLFPKTFEIPENQYSIPHHLVLFIFEIMSILWAYRLSIDLFFQFSTIVVVSRDDVDTLFKWCEY